jgi:hypothetical protein
MAIVLAGTAMIVSNAWAVPAAVGTTAMAANAKLS